MKTIFTVLLLVATAVLCVAPGQLRGQTPDTVMVGASPVGNINNYITGDTTATGARVNPNRVYELYRDSIYYFTGQINANFSLAIIAESKSQATGPGALPVIAPAILSDNSSPTTFIRMTYGNLTLERLYLLGIRPDQQSVSKGLCIIVTGDSDAVFKVDSCAFDGWSSRAILDHGKWDSYYITNCLFRNLENPTGWYLGQGLETSTSVPTDTIMMVNNTMLCNNSYQLAEIYYNKYTLFEHNTIFLTVETPLYIPQLVNGDIKDNIFYGTLAACTTRLERAGALNQNPSPVAFDTLFNVGTDFSLTEADRHINVIDNDYYWPQRLQTFYATPLMDTLIAPAWMNTQDSLMFSDSEKTVWPHLVQQGNVNADPEFPSVVSGQVDSLIKYITLIWTKGLRSYLWYYNPNGGLYPPVWPAPENLTYTNSALMHAAEGGFPVGDLNWFPAEKAAWLAAGGVNAIKENTPKAPTKFNLTQNYPNPFNPSTTIRVDLARSGLVSLKVYNVLGQLVKVVDQGYKAAGEYNYNVNMDKFASGVYFYILQEGSNFMAKKMVLLK